MTLPDSAGRERSSAVLVHVLNFTKTWCDLPPDEGMFLVRWGERSKATCEDCIRMCEKADELR